MNAGTLNGESRAGKIQATSQCLLVRVDPLRLLVPRVTVAEVINAEGLKFSQSLNKAIHVFLWRGRQVPLLCASVLDPRCAESAAEGEKGKIAVFHGLLRREKLPFYALRLSANPRLLMVTPASLKDGGETQDGQAVLCRVSLDGEPALIPRLDYLEKFIHTHFFH